MSHFDGNPALWHTSHFLSTAPVSRVPYYFFVSAWFGWQFAFARVTFTFLFLRDQAPHPRVKSAHTAGAMTHEYKLFKSKSFPLKASSYEWRKSSQKWERPCLPAMGINCFRCQQVTALKKASDIQLACESRRWGRGLVPGLNVCCLCNRSFFLLFLCWFSRVAEWT